MESWSYISDGKGLISNSTAEPPSSSISGSKNNAFMNWELKTPTSSFGNLLLVSGQHPQEIGQSFGGFSVPELIRKQQQQQLRCDSNPIMSALSAFSEDSNSIVESSSRDSSFIDLKLGRLGDIRDHSSKFPQRPEILCSSESSTPTKRARASGINSQTAYCQVYGCNKDLSSCKDYHKRHKVCEVHSKTATVIVNGIQQRFCQQCSRFHLLAEFDDGKRSCRKRLAGHNERRRKPQGGVHSGRSGRLLQTYTGNRLQGNTFTPTSFICQDILPRSGGLLNPEKYVTSHVYGQVKVEDRMSADYGPLSAIPIANGQIHSKIPISQYTFDKHFPFFQDDSSLGAEDFSAFTTAPTTTIHGLSGISEPGCALSLLSSQSQNSSSHSSGFPMAQSLMGVVEPMSSSPEGNNHNQTGPVMISGCSSAANFGVSEQILHGKEDGPTISLSQLSSQLQRVESQRQSLQAKQGNEAFCCPRIT